MCYSLISEDEEPPITGPKQAAPKKDNRPAKRAASDVAVVPPAKRVATVKPIQTVAAAAPPAPVVEPPRQLQGAEPSAEPPRGQGLPNEVLQSNFLTCHPRRFVSSQVAPLIFFLVPHSFPVLVVTQFRVV